MLSLMTPAKPRTISSSLLTCCKTSCSTRIVPILIWSKCWRNLDVTIGNVCTWYTTNDIQCLCLMCCFVTLITCQVTLSERSKHILPVLFYIIPTAMERSPRAETIVLPNRIEVGRSIWCNFTHYSKRATWCTYSECRIETIAGPVNIWKRCVNHYGGTRFVNVCTNVSTNTCRWDASNAVS